MELIIYSRPAAGADPRRGDASLPPAIFNNALDE